MAYARGFTDLVVYQKAKAVSRTVFQVSKSFPPEEMYSLTDQIRRAARSIGAQIAEAWAKRRYEKHFASKLSDADAEQMETQHWVGEALDCGYITPAQSGKLTGDLLEIGRMLGSMIEKADAFCDASKNIVREDSSEYFVVQR
jgi:four helix bundle protein